VHPLRLLHVEGVTDALGLSSYRAERLLKRQKRAQRGVERVHHRQTGPRTGFILGGILAGGFSLVGAFCFLRAFCSTLFNLSVLTGERLALFFLIGSSGYHVAWDRITRYGNFFHWKHHRVGSHFVLLRFPRLRGQCLHSASMRYDSFLLRRASSGSTLPARLSM